MKIDGQKIYSLQTMKSWNDNDCLRVYFPDGAEGRMPVTTVMQMLNQFVFTAFKKTKYVYLTEAEPLYDEHGLNRALWKEANNATNL